MDICVGNDGQEREEGEELNTSRQRSQLHLSKSTASISAYLGSYASAPSVSHPLRKDSTIDITADEIEPKDRPRMPDFSAPAEMVTFEIGSKPNTQTFAVHKEFACYYSPVLNFAFNNNFLEGNSKSCFLEDSNQFHEGDSKSYYLEDTNSTTFRIFVSWLYSQKLDIYLDLDAEIQSDSSRLEEMRRNSNNYVRLWLLGDKLLIPKLQNAAMEKLETVWGWNTQHKQMGIPAPDTVTYIWNHTKGKCVLRDLVIDQYAFYIQYQESNDLAQNLSQEILLEVSLVLGKVLKCTRKPGSQWSIYKLIRKSRSYLVPEVISQCS